MVRSACGVLLACLLGFSLQTPANENPPSSVKDLQYGEVLFHFYQQDYFNSIVRLKVAQHQQRLPNHANEAELLLGGLSLSYGLRNEANDIFRTLLTDEGSDRHVRNRAWYHLARISYQRGDTHRALQALEQISGKASNSNRAEAAYLQSLLLLEDGRNEEAIRVMQATKSEKAWSPYLKYNMGIARIRNQQFQQGTRQLEQVGLLSGNTEELRLLRDKANLALGFTYLKEDDAGQSMRVLERVRLEGPLSNKALLGAGWADASAEAYGQALVPWMELGTRNPSDPAVQEVLLAIPYAMAKMNRYGQAVRYYDRGIEILLEERLQLDQSIQAIRNGGILEALQSQETGDENKWLEKLTTIAESPALRYQVELMASHDFQEAVRNYQDTLAIQDNLGQWADNMEAYDSMLSARQLRYEKHRPAAMRALQSDVPGKLQQRHTELEYTIAAIESGDTPIGLARSQETRQWQQLETIGKRLDQLPAGKELDGLREKQKRLQGILYWQIASDFKPRLWQAKRELETLANLIEESERSAEALRQADYASPTEFMSFRKRIERQRKSIRKLSGRTEKTRISQGRQVEDLAVAQLEKQKQRLDAYLIQARFALAQTYDNALSSQAGAGQ